ncbi:LCP family protein [Blastococcus sp. TML/C7B]|uniref:LCP family glycopolymer transferase n=1 Tax=Blastococcus sp. TML/C7B TaxID=2798728 RepID=UPI0028165F20|nr:LCP family protein [Blastococcus sp. TML/C7B]
MHRAGSFRAALGWTALNALLPGTAFLAAGRRVLGGVVLGVFLLLAAGGVWVATGGQRSALRAAVDTSSLLWIVGGVALGALLWSAVVVTGYLAVLPRGTSRGRRVVGGGLVLLLAAAVLAPAALAGQVALTQRDLISDVFTDDGRSATVDQDDSDPFGDKERINVLLLGGDGGEGRDGVRTDTVIVASIDTDDGETTLFSLPRNLEDLPFPESSPLADLYPDGFDAGSESESLLNAVYRNGPAMHPDVLGPTDNPGADWLKLGVGEALGLDIDYYVLINLDGFSRLVDALGGITVDVQLLGADRRRAHAGHAARRLHRARPEPVHGRRHRAGVRARPVRPHRLRPDGPAALHDRRDHRRRRPDHPAAQVPAAGAHHEGRRLHRHPALGAGRLRGPGVPGEGRRHPQRGLRRLGDQPGLPRLRQDPRHGLPGAPGRCGRG